MKRFSYFLILCILTLLLGCSSNNSQKAKITFSYDDGFNSAYTTVVPLHEKYKIPATFNIIANKLEDFTQWSKYLDPTKLKNIDKRGFEIASHSYSHQNLTKLNDEKLDYELLHSKDVIEKTVGHKITILSIPNSEYDTRIESVAKKYYTGVRQYGSKLNDLTPNDPYNLQSFAVFNTTQFDEIKNRIDDAVVQKKWLIIMLHDVVDEPTTKYQISSKLLQQTLEYVHSLGEDKIIPVSTSSALKK